MSFVLSLNPENTMKQLTMTNLTFMMAPNKQTFDNDKTYYHNSLGGPIRDSKITTIYDEITKYTKHGSFSVLVDSDIITILKSPNDTDRFNIEIESFQIQDCEMFKPRADSNGSYLKTKSIFKNNHILNENTEVICSGVWASLPYNATLYMMAMNSLLDTPSKNYISLEIISEQTDNVFVVSELEHFCKEYDIDTCTKFINNNFSIKISKDRSQLINIPETYAVKINPFDGKEEKLLIETAQSLFKN